MQVLHNAFFLDHPPPRNANNIFEPYTFVTLFPGKCNPPIPSALRDTWTAPKQTLDKLMASLSAAIWGVLWMAILLNLV